MKLLYTRKQFQGMVEEYESEIEQIQKAYKILEKYASEMLIEKDNYKSKFEKLFKKNVDTQIDNGNLSLKLEELDNKYNNLSKKYKSVCTAKGGFIKQINKLQDKLNEAEIKLSQRYIIKELAPEKSKNTQIMKTKSSTVASKIIKKVVEGNEKEK